MEDFENIREFIESNSILVNGDDGDSISIKTIKSREGFLSRLSQLHRDVSELYSLLSDTLRRSQETQQREIKAIDNLIISLKRGDHRADSKSQPNLSEKEQSEAAKTETLIPQANSQPRSWLAIAKRPPVGSGDISTVNPPSYTRIKFTEALSLPAIMVTSFDKVKQDGELYFVECANHFAFRICGHLFHGNIGNIYTDERNPDKIKNCKFAAKCTKQDKCDYYHNPIDYPGSKDYRNFIASSWMYTPQGYGRFHRGRKFGSRNSLDVDIVELNGEDISRFQDQTMHDILCSLLLIDSYRRS